MEGVVDLTEQHGRLAHGEFESLAAHGLDQDGELQFTPALDLPGVWAFGGQDADRDVSDQLGIEAGLDLAGGQLGAVRTGHRRGVDTDRHRERRLVDRDDG